MDPTIDKLQKLALLQHVQGSEADNTPDLVKMLSELYGIHEKQQVTPGLLARTAAETDLAKAHADAYANSELPEERNARGVLAKATSVDALSRAGLPKEAVEAYARKMGLLPEAPPVAKPHDAFGPGSGTTPTQPVFSATAPGHLPGLGGGLKELPRQTADLGAQIANYGYLPIHNTVASVLGTQPINAVPRVTHYPSREEFAATSPEWLTNLLYKKPAAVGATTP